MKFIISVLNDSQSFALVGMIFSVLAMLGLLSLKSITELSPITLSILVVQFLICVDLYSSTKR